MSSKMMMTGERWYFVFWVYPRIMTHIVDVHTDGGLVDEFCKGRIDTEDDGWVSEFGPSSSIPSVEIWAVVLGESIWANGLISHITGMYAVLVEFRIGVNPTKHELPLWVGDNADNYMDH